MMIENTIERLKEEIIDLLIETLRGKILNIKILKNTDLMTEGVEVINRSMLVQKE